MYDKELSAAGKRRVLVHETVLLDDRCLSVFREKVVPIASTVKPKGKGKFKMMNVENYNAVQSAVTSSVRARVANKKAPREGSKLNQATAIVRQLGKDNREACLVELVNTLNIKRGNATIYFAKAVDILAQE
jgi:hypothetical protein